MVLSQQQSFRLLLVDLWVSVLWPGQSFHLDLCGDRCSYWSRQEGNSFPGHLGSHSGRRDVSWPYRISREEGLAPRIGSGLLLRRPRPQAQGSENMVGEGVGGWS